MRLTARSALSQDGLFGIQRQTSATIWGSVALGADQHTALVEEQEECVGHPSGTRQEEGRCQVMTCPGCFSQDNQTGGMSHSAPHPSLNSTSCDWHAIRIHREPRLADV